MADDRKLAVSLAEAVKEKGGRAFYVGGCVRDKILGTENKDIDIEVHGIEVWELENILDSLGERLQFGKSFGVYNLKGSSVDIAMPRKEKLTGSKHTDFKIDINPFLGTEKAAMRRDFTVNALMEDILTGEIVDHFGGVDDIKNKVIRHVNDESFAEDPLRVLRGAQFAARFEFDMDSSTTELCKTMSLCDISSERVFGEMKKALLKAKRPSLFFEILREMNQLSVWFPEVEALIGVVQSKKHHKEGDVYNHTMMVLDSAACFREKVKNPLWFMLSALVHDFGKAVTTEISGDEVHAIGHEKEGVHIAENFLLRITNEKQLIKYVLNMVENHMKPNVLAKDKSSVKATNKMFDKSAEPIDLIYLAVSDGLGKISETEYVRTDDFLIDRLNIYNEYMSRPYVTGSDLIAAGIEPGVCFSEVMAYAHKLRLAGVKKDAALKQTVLYYKSNVIGKNGN